MNDNLVTKIHEYLVQNKDSSMRVWVAKDILEDSEDAFLSDHIKYILDHGCVDGTVSSLVYQDTDKFFDDFSDECLELLDKLIKGRHKIFFTIDKNNLAWWCYEEVTREIADFIGLEY